MAKKYHITKDGQVLPCRAFLRACPLTDYDNEKSARSALIDLQNSQKHEEKIEKLRKILDDYDHTVFLNADVSGDLNNQQPRHFVKKIEQTYSTNDSSHMKMMSSNPLKLDNYNNYMNSFSLTLDSIPKLVEEDETIVNRWTLEYSYRNNKNKKKEVYALDLMTDRENSMFKAESIIREALIQNAYPHIDAKSLTYDTNTILNQIDEIHSIFDEEVSGPYYSWKLNPEHGTFAFSKEDFIQVDANYNLTLFRGRTFERFVKESDWYKYVTPEINIQVYDNENGSSNSSWRLVTYSRKWFIQTVVNGGNPNPIRIHSAEEGREFMKNFVANHMPDNSPETVREKSDYVYDLMKTIDCVSDEYHIK